MLNLADIPRLDEKVDEIRRQIERPDALVWVEGTAGAGRSTIVQRIQESRPSVHIEPPSLDHPDAALHALLQAASHLGREGIHHALDSGPSLRDRARTLGNQMAAENRTLLLQLPSSWGDLGPARSPDGDAFRKRAIDLLRGFRDASSLRIIVLSLSGHGQYTRRLLGVSTVIQLEHAQLSPDVFRHLDAWRDYEPIVALVQKALDAYPLPLTPLQLRLLVGLTALGENPERVLDEMRPSRGAKGMGNLGALLQSLRKVLKQPEHGALRACLVRWSRARYPLDRAFVLKLGKDLPAHDELLLTECLGYPDPRSHRIRMTAPVRATLQELAPLVLVETHWGPVDRNGVVVQELASTHEMLADYYQGQDGVLSPWETHTHTMLPWLEKVHHLAHAGPDAEARWRDQHHPGREFYWDRGRALSIDSHDYEAAAVVYRECVERYPDDDYAWHYYAWNLDRIGQEPAEVEHGFREAIALNGSNPWWNSRLVTFLIEQARFREADQEWVEVLDRLDPTRERVFDDPDLARQVHRWIVGAWLDEGEISSARRAFDAIPPQIVQQEPVLLELEWRLRDAEEAEALGETIYPAGIPIPQRWRRPSMVREVGPHGTPLEAWFPGRIVGFDGERLVIVIAVPEPALERRRVIETYLSPEEWSKAKGWCPPAEADGHFVLVRYQNDQDRIYPLFVQPAPWEEPREWLDPLRYLRRWSERQREKEIPPAAEDTH